MLENSPEVRGVFGGLPLFRGFESSANRLEVSRTLAKEDKQC
jgi:hypothetical protein